MNTIYIEQESLEKLGNMVQELQKENKKLKKDIISFKVRLLDAREARDNATKVANTYLYQNADLSKKVHILNEANEKKYNELCAEIEKNKKLKEQLKEANGIIKQYAEKTMMGYPKNDGTYVLCKGTVIDEKKVVISTTILDPRPANDYLKKWGVK